MIISNSLNLNFLLCRWCGKKIISDRYIIYQTVKKSNPLNERDVFYDDNGFLIYIYCLKCDMEIQLVNKDMCSFCGLELDDCKCEGNKK